MALMSSMSFSLNKSKRHYKKSHKNATLPRKAKKTAAAAAAADPVLDVKIGEITQKMGHYQTVVTKPADNHKRRAIVLYQRDKGSWGFTLQSYGLYHGADREVDVWTYVDYVALDGPAAKAGMRAGDIIISINGQSTDHAKHETIVDMINSSPSDVRMVVLFQNCVQKVQLHQRLLKLKNLLALKERQLRDLTEQEQRIIEGIDLTDVSDTSQDESSHSSPSRLQRAVKLTSSLPTLPTANLPTASLPTLPSLSRVQNMKKSVSLSSAAENHPSDERRQSESGGLGSEIRLLDPATIASVGACPSPLTLRRYAASPSFGKRRTMRGSTLRRHDAIKRGGKPCLGIKPLKPLRKERYSSDGHADNHVVDDVLTDSDDDAFISLSPKVSPTRETSHPNNPPPTRKTSHPNSQPPTRRTSHPNSSPPTRKTSHPSSPPPTRRTSHPNSPPPRKTSHPSSPPPRKTSHPNSPPRTRKTSLPNSPPPTRRTSYPKSPPPTRRTSHPNSPPPTPKTSLPNSPPPTRRTSHPNSPPPTRRTSHPNSPPRTPKTSHPNSPPPTRKTIHPSTPPRSPIGPRIFDLPPASSPKVVTPSSSFLFYTYGRNEKAVGAPTKHSSAITAETVIYKDYYERRPVPMLSVVRPRGSTSHLNQMRKCQSMTSCPSEELVTSDPPVSCRPMSPLVLEPQPAAHRRVLEPLPADVRRAWDPLPADDGSVLDPFPVGDRYVLDPLPADDRRVNPLKRPTTLELTHESSDDEIITFVSQANVITPL